MRPTELQLQAIFYTIDNARTTDQFTAPDVRTGWFMPQQKATAGSFEYITLGQRSIELVGEGFRIRFADVQHLSLAIKDLEGNDIEGNWEQDFQEYLDANQRAKDELEMMAERLREEAQIGLDI